MYILGRHLSEKQFKTLSPATVRTQGKEIVRTWLYYSFLKNYLVNGFVPFKEVWVNYHIVDDKGKKMSKSKGNVVNPKEVLEKFGAEPFRLWAVIEGELTKTDFRCSFERIEGAGKTITKLFNVAKFITQFPFNPKAKYKLNTLDEMILNEMNGLIALADEKYAEYDFHTPAVEVKRFIWETFASHYLEMAKIRAYNQDKKYSAEEQAAAIYTLNYCLEKMLKILSPILPMFTEKIHSDLYGKNPHFSEFPKAGKKVKTGIEIKELMDLNGLIWKAKKDANVSLKNPIKELVLDSKFKAIEKDLRAVHSVEKLSYGQQTKIVI
jgi:valyl-tRNA synthetase